MTKLKHPRVKGNRNRNKVIEYFRDRGFLVGIVERTGRFIKDKDLFGFGDIIAIGDTDKPMLVQVTSNTPHSARAYLKLSRDKRVKRGLDLVQVIVKDRSKFAQVIEYSNGHIRKDVICMENLKE